MIVASIDGGARGNPGPAGYGVHIEDGEGRVIAELHGPIGIATNNVAEYRGLLAALDWALASETPDLHIRADSELLVRQMRGEYRVKHANLKPLFLEACSRIRQLGGRVTFTHVRREQNQEADRLSNLAMDEAERGAKTKNEK
jgi:probable phosphoglycerate mutase